LTSQPVPTTSKYVDGADLDDALSIPDRVNYQNVANPGDFVDAGHINVLKNAVIAIQEFVGKREWFGKLLPTVTSTLTSREKSLGAALSNLFDKAESTATTLSDVEKSLVPVGTIIAYMGATAPADGVWLPCDGSSIPNIAAYGQLRTLLNSDKTPNLSERFLRQGDMGVERNQGGTTALNGSHLPRHRHDYGDLTVSNHQHTLDLMVKSNVSLPAGTGSVMVPQISGSSTGNSSSSITLSGNTGYTPVQVPTHQEPFVPLHQNVLFLIKAR
jgi:Phage Tail Collar Domain